MLVRNSKAHAGAAQRLPRAGHRGPSESKVLLGPEGLQRTLARVNTMLAQTHQQVVETVGLFREAAENASASPRRCATTRRCSCSAATTRTS